MAVGIVITDGTNISRCPHCGQEMPGQLTVDLEFNLAKANGKSVRLSPMQAEILEAIRRTHPRPARTAYIAEAVGGLHGNESSWNSIQVMICQMRPKLSLIGVEVPSAGNSSYHLQVGDIVDRPIFSEADEKAVRAATKVLLKARRIVG